VLGRIRELNPRLNAYLAVSEERAMEQATLAERELCAKSRGTKRRDRGPLHGIPISLKDNIYSAGVRTTGGSKILREFVPPYDAPVVSSLKQAGAVILGKTNLHEFAYGVTTENPHFGATRNPWDLERIAGGSSGGSAAALAAGLCYGSIGTDTGGSIRIPASLCGVVGLKPGIGRVNAQDVIPLSKTLDVVGPMARTVEDSSVLFQAISVERRARRASGSGPPLFSRGRFTLGVPREFFFDVLSPEVELGFETAIRVLKRLGARFKEISIPLLEESEEAGNQIAWAEATCYHQEKGWFPERAREYGKDVRRRLEMGTKVSALDYLRALRLREEFAGSLTSAMRSDQLDALLVPATPIAAPRLGEDSVIIKGRKHRTRALLLRLNRPANLAGIPAISIPCGLTRGGLPVGIQFIGRLGGEHKLLGLASRFERACPLNAQPTLDFSD
jgi:aspartyl-tRNA(Asn)/glutamyl-tRNA(Gln) amidotransferase subunit A